MYKNTKKDDLIRVVKELGMISPDGATIVNLKELIEQNAVFKKEPDFVKDLICSFVEERKEQEQTRKEQE